MEWVLYYRHRRWWGRGKSSARKGLEKTEKIAGTRKQKESGPNITLAEKDEILV